MESIEAVASQVVSCLTKTPARKMRGSQLAGLLKYHFPDFTPAAHGCRNFREFIKKYVPGAFELERSGMDFVYGVSSPPLTDDAPKEAITAVKSSGSPHVRGSAATSPRIDYEAFRVFKSPNCPLSLLADTRTGALRVQASNLPFENPWVRVPPCSPESHKKIALDFVTQLIDEGQRSELAQLIARSPQSWWFSFWRRIGELGLVNQWSTFRKSRLMAEMEASLVQLGLPVKGGQAAPSGLQRTPRSVPAGLQPTDNVQDEAFIRSLVARVINTISLAELRSLRLPLGDIVDALKR